MDYDIEHVHERRENVVFEEEFDLRSLNFSVRKSSLHPAEQEIVDEVLKESGSDEAKITSEILKKRSCVIVQGLIFIISLTVLINVLFLGYIDDVIGVVKADGCQLPDIVGDGYCDDETNTFICGFDGGDCCGDNIIAGNCHQCMCLSKLTKESKVKVQTAIVNFNNQTFSDHCANHNLFHCDHHNHGTSRWPMCPMCAKRCCLHP